MTNPIRKFIRIIENIIEEKYTNDNSYLYKYLKNKEFDPYAFWFDIREWLEENDYLEKIGELLGKEIVSADDLEDFEPEIFYKLPKDIQERCANDVIEKIFSIDPVEAPTWAHMHLNGKLLPRNTWLVHFTDKPYDIQKEGFKYGIDQMDRLGLTTWLKDTLKKYGGYNFAFKALSREAKFCSSKSKYGKHAVLFQNSGVQAYHNGDEENQIIFWGADVNPKDIIVLYNDYGDWIVKSRVVTKRGDYNLFRGTFEQCVTWIIKNYQQYRKYLTGY